MCRKIMKAPILIATVIILYAPLVYPFYTFVPPNKQLIYNWTASVRVGTQIGQMYASSFILEGRIHVQSHASSILVSIKNVTYKISNGIYNENYENQINSSVLPKETLDELEKTFRISYTNQGLVKGLTTNSEREFSKNIKRGLASIFQFSTETLWENVFVNHPTIMIDEPSLHGNTTFTYDLRQSNDDDILLNKYELPSPYKYAYSYTNVQSEKCPKAFEPLVINNNRRTYFIRKGQSSDEQFLCNKIVSLSDLTYYLFQPKYQFIKTDQSMELIEEREADNLDTLIEGQYEDNLRYVAFQPSEDGSVYDLTNGRRSINKQMLTNMTLQSLINICSDESSTNPENKRINRIQDLLLKLNETHLETIRLNLDGNPKCFEYFIRILPLVGTRASTKFIKKMIINSEVNEDDAIYLLENVHQNLMDTDWESLEGFYALTYANLPLTVQNSALINFATLVGKYRDEKIIYNYVSKYCSLFAEIDHYGKKMAYLLGIMNMNSINIEHLTSLFLDKRNQNFRYHLGWAIIRKVRDNKKIINEPVWPILTNRNESQELRIMSYYHLMLSRPNNATLKKILAVVSEETDSELYSFHYSFVKEMSQSKNPCMEDFKYEMAQLVKLSEPSSRGLSSFQLVDYLDYTGYFGAEIHFLHIQSETERIYIWNKYSHEFDTLKNDYLIHLKFNIIEFYEGRGGRVPFAELITIRDGSIISHSWGYIYLEALYNAFHKIFTIDYETSMNIIPLDLGIPAFLDVQIPSVTRNFLRFKKGVKDVEIDNELTQWSYHRNGLDVYNPFVDGWHGINRVFSYDVFLPIRINFTMNSEQELKATWNRKNTDNRKQTGVSAAVKQIIFFRESFGKNISQMFPNLKNFQVVDYEQKLKNITLFEQNLPTGHKLQVKVFNGNTNLDLDFLAQFVRPAENKFQTPLGHLLIAAVHLQDSLQNLEFVGYYGFEMILDDSDFNLESCNATMLWNASSVRIYLGTKGLDENVKTTRISGNYSSNNTVKKFKLEACVMPCNDGKQFSFLITGEKRLTSSGVSGELSKFTISHSIPIFDYVKITMTGQKSPEQEINSSYACNHLTPFKKTRFSTLDSLLAHLSVKNYTLALSGDSLYAPRNFTLQSSTSTPIVQIESTNFIHSLPISYLSYFGVYPDSLIPLELVNLEKNGLVRHYNFKDEDYSRINGNLTLYSTEEVKILKNVCGNGIIVVFNGKYAIITFDKNPPQVHLDGDNDWFSYDVINTGSENVLIAVINNSLYLECHCNGVIIIEPQKDLNWLTYLSAKLKF